MGLFRKKEEKDKSKNKSEIPGLPELPELPELPDFPGKITSKINRFPDLSELSPTPNLPNLNGLNEQENRFHEIPSLKYKNIQGLPSFPGSQMGEAMSQEAVKSAVNLPEYEETIGSSKERRTIEISEPKMQMSRQIKNPIMPVFQSRDIKMSRKIEPVYIRIDKFKSAAQSFEEIKEKIAEIESLLSDIKEVKQKEEQELSEWEREVETIKARIEAIDNNIFSKLD